MDQAPILLLFNCSKEAVAIELANALQKVAMIYPACGQSIKSRLVTTWTEWPETSDIAMPKNDQFGMHSALSIGYAPAFKKRELYAAYNRAPLAEVAMLGEILRAVAVLWQPQNILTHFSEFDSAVEAMECHGHFPMSATLTFDMLSQGQIASRGLAWFIGQELVFSSLYLKEPEAIKRIEWFLNNVVSLGPVEAKTSYSGLLPNERLMLTLSDDRSIIYLNALLV
jgi:hypothetical protein